MNGSNNIYLCQVSESVSCGACCGLYNLPHISHGKLWILLSKRTKEFESVPRTEEEIFEFKRRNKGPHRLSRPFPQFHHCPFLGLTCDKKGCVACLLHPAMPGNNGIDYRALSWYGEKACRGYFCPTTYKLPDVYKSILKLAIDNWYDFGLIVTEHALVTAYFMEIESRLGRAITVSDYAKNIQAIVTFRKFAGLKSNWPYRRHGAPGPCNFFFENGLYQRPAVVRATSDIRLSPYEKILMELDSGFSSAQELETADQLLNDLFLSAERALR